MRVKKTTESDNVAKPLMLCPFQLIPVCTFLVANLAGSTCSAQVIFNDFVSGWTNFHNFADADVSLETSSNEGEYTIGVVDNVIGSGAALSCWDASFDGGFSDGILRVTARSNTAAGYPLLLMRLASVAEVPGSYGMSATPSDQGFFALGRSEDPPAFLATLPSSFTANQEWVFEAGTNGDEISLKVWRAGEPEPSKPQMTAVDSKYSDGGFCLAAAMWPGYRDKPSVTYRDVVFIRPTDRLVGGWRSIGRDVKNDAEFELASTDTWVFEIDAENKVADALEVTGTLNANESALVIQILNGDLESGDSFDLLDSQDFGGEFALIELPELPDSMQWYANDLYIDGSIAVTNRGDYNNNGVLDAPDIDLLSEAVVFGGTSLFDLTGDGSVDNADREFWLSELADTDFGDANLDHQVDFADFLTLSAAFSKNGGWAMGDFDGNRGVDFADFLLLSANFGQTAGVVTTIPEPSNLSLTVIGIMGWLYLRQHRRHFTSSNGARKSAIQGRRYHRSGFDRACPRSRRS